MKWGRFWLVVVLLGANFASALAVVHAQHRNRTAFVELETLRADRDRLNAEWGRLQLEESAWATHGRIERLAREQLDMHIPEDPRMVVVEQ